MTTPTSLISSLKSFAAVYRPHMTAKYHTTRTMPEKILTSSMLNRSLCPLHPKHHSQRHRIENVHPAIFAFPQFAFRRQTRCEFIWKLHRKNFSHFLFCSFRLAKQQAPQLFS